MLTEAKGNLLEATADALVNTVNTDGVMGKGIALQFKERFPKMFQDYREACRAGKLAPGRMHIFELNGADSPQYIINFPTKRHWRSPSRIEDIKSGLVTLKEDIRRLGIRSIALPALGCGNGGLNWEEVRPLIESELGSLSDVHTVVYPPMP